MNIRDRGKQVKSWMKPPHDIDGFHLVLGFLCILLAFPIFTVLIHCTATFGYIPALVGIVFSAFSGIFVFFLVVRYLLSIRRTAEYLRRTDRILRVLSACNQALKQAVREDELLERIGSIIIEEARYRFTFIGCRAADGDCHVNVVMKKGSAGDYLGTAEACWLGETKESCPVIRALLYGEKSIVRSLAETGGDEPCRVAARENGYVSLIALPLKTAQTTFGVLAIFSSKPGAFDEGEEKLLTELSNVLSFGIAALRRNRECLAALESKTASEKEYRMLFETMTQGIIRMSPAGEITGSNPASERMLGLTADRMRLDVPHYHTLGVIDEDGAEIPRDSFPPIAALRTGREVRNVVVGLCNPYDGRRRWLLVNAIPQYREWESEPYQVLSTLEDITEYKNMGSRIRYINERLETIFQSAPLAIFDLDSEGRVNSLWNDAAERMFGWSEDEVLGKPLPIVPKEGMVEFSLLLERVLCEESLSGNELTKVRKDGSPIDISLAAAPLHDQHGAVTGIMAIASDVTDHNALERQYLHAQKMEAVGRLAGGVAHDFNNILTVILGNVSILMFDHDTGGECHEILKEIQENATRASGLTRQLLAFSRRQIIEPRIIILNSVLTNMEKMLGRIIGEDIELVTMPDGDLWPVLIDPGQIEQVITNLAINARDAMPYGGKLTIETGNVTLDEEYVQKHVAMKPGDYVMVAVSDTGCGMDSETQEKIFEPFFTTKETGKGTGLGLATCYGIVKQNGGFIWVYSEPGTGTEFKIYLPRIVSPLIEETTGNEIPRDLHGTETLLLVEDEPAVRATLARILRKYGYKVLKASNGDEARKITDGFGIRMIDLVVTDIVMPRMGGKEFMAELRMRAPNVHVLFISGYTDMSIVSHIATGKNASFLQKPFSPLTLARKIRDILDGGSVGTDG